MTPLTDIDKAAALARPVTVAELIAALRECAREVVVCVPSTDYYARRDDWDRETVSVIDTELLITRLMYPPEE